MYCHFPSHPLFILSAAKNEERAGSRKREAGSGKPEAGSRKREAGSGKPEAESRKPEAAFTVSLSHCLTNTPATFPLRFLSFIISI